MAVITISRQFGAGGRTLGKMLAEDLGYTFVDQELIQMIAEKANVTPSWVESVEKEAGKTLSRVISHLFSEMVMDRILKNDYGYLDEKIYLDYLVVLVAQMAEEGNAVILGRGSQYILKDHPDAYHVLLIDQFDNRVRFMMKHYEMTRDKAVNVVKNEDKRRMNLYRKLGKEDYNDPALYHITLNMGRLELSQAAKVVRSLIES
jgi:cytidylate kinase